MDPMQDAVKAMSDREVELIAKGFHPPLVEAAVKRALGAATYKTRPISAEIKGQAFLDVLRHELDQAETWLGREMKTLDNLPDNAASYEKGGIR